MVDVLLRSGANETVQDTEGFTSAARIGQLVAEEELVVEDYERVRKLLKNAPADRTLRRRGLFVLCRACHDRVQLTQESNRARAGVSSGSHGGATVSWRGQ